MFARRSVFERTFEGRGRGISKGGIVVRFRADEKLKTINERSGAGFVEEVAIGAEGIAAKGRGGGGDEREGKGTIGTNFAISA